MRGKHDFNRVRPEHMVIHDRLANWGEWGRTLQGAAEVSPMFRLYRPTSEDTAAIDKDSGPLPARHGVDTEDAQAMEALIVGRLKKAEKLILIWFYVRKSSPAKIRRRLRLSYVDMEEILHAARETLAFCKIVYENHVSN